MQRTRRSATFSTGRATLTCARSATRSGSASRCASSNAAGFAPTSDVGAGCLIADRADTPTGRERRPDRSACGCVPSVRLCRSRIHIRTCRHRHCGGHFVLTLTRTASRSTIRVRLGPVSQTSLTRADYIKAMRLFQQAPKWCVIGLRSIADVAGRRSTAARRRTTWRAASSTSRRCPPRSPPERSHQCIMYSSMSHSL